MDFLWHPIFMQHVGKDMLEPIVTLTWCMWCNRNKSWLGSPRQSSEEMIYKAQTLLADFQVAHLRCLQPKTTDDSLRISPSFPWYKVNTDAAVFKNSKSVGIGVVVRDHEGSILAALSKRLPLPLGPLEAEAKAMEEAISFTIDIGLHEAIFETDSLALSRALIDMSTVPIIIENCIGGIHLKLQNFRQSHVQHVRREGNKPAHTLAHHAKGIDNFVTWIEETPSFIESFVTPDALYFSSYFLSKKKNSLITLVFPKKK